MFRYEKDLVNSIIENKDEFFNDYRQIAKIPKSNKIEYLEEVNLGHGIADLVFILSQNSNTIRNKPLSIHDINLYHLCKQKYMTHIDELIEKTRFHKYRINNSLKLLESEKFVTICNNYIIIKNDYNPYQNMSIAIEAKLKNWKCAFNQAARYKLFATESYVIMDNDFVKKAEQNIQMFEIQNIGLGSVSSSGKIKLFHRPKSTEPINKNMQVLLSEYLHFRA